jgi:hypothetical protein
MLNTNQSVFFSVTQVFMSIYRLFQKIEAPKMQPYFKMLIFCYRSRFLTNFSIFLWFSYALNATLSLFFVLDIGITVKNGLQKTDLFWVLPLVVVPSSDQNRKIPSDSSFSYRKTLEYKISANLKNFLKIRIFISRGKKFECKPFLTAIMRSKNNGRFVCSAYENRRNVENFVKNGLL